MTHPMIGRSGRAALVAVISALALLAAGCVQLPEEGAVHETDTSADTSVEQASSIDVVPPRPNAQPADIAKGFIDAMSAWPIQTGIAREFLTEEAGLAWRPDQGTITFADSLVEQESSTVMRVRIPGAERLDRRGAWQGELPESEQTLRLEMTHEDGEYRITNPPDALVVPASWFAQRFRQVSLYFFDRTGQILVPEPVFVPRGDQLASTLIARLVQGPGVGLRQVSRTYLPKLEPGLSVPVTDEGVAQVELGGSVAAPQAGDDVEHMLAQLGWTLRQVPGIRALRVSIGGQGVALPSGDTEYPVNRDQQFDPAGADANPLLYGLRDGRLVYGEADSLATARGPFGEDAGGVRSVSVNLDASRAAAVSSDGGSLLVAPVRDADDEVRQLDIDATDLLPPAWDFTGRIWVVDRTRRGARVGYLKGDEQGTLEVPGVTGRQVRAFLVSRDATRFVAVVRGRSGDQVRAGRILVDEQGRIDRAGPTRGIPIGEDDVRIRDIAWTSPTSIAVLHPVADELFEVSTVAVDGAPTVAEPLATSISGRVVGLAAAPDDSRTPYAVTREELIDLESLATVPFSDGRVTSLGYVG
jgi:hypothetical protein